MCKEYNGYTNYPTWNIMLWIDNDPGLYDEARELVRNGYSYQFEAELALKEWVEELIYGFDSIPSAGMSSDLMGWALSNVNWMEIVNLLQEED